MHREVFVGLGICGFLLGLVLLHEDLEEVFFPCQADEKHPIQRFSDSRFTERPYPRDAFGACGGSASLAPGFRNLFRSTAERGLFVRPGLNGGKGCILSDFG